MKVKGPMVSLTFDEYLLVSAGLDELAGFDEITAAQKVLSEAMDRA